jgi:hypothetical protein
MAQVDLHPAGQRQAIREGLTSTRAGFHVLLDGLTDDDLRPRSGSPAWTVGAVLTHLVGSLELLPREDAAARIGNGMFNMPPLLRDVLNIRATRLAARGQTLDGIRDDEFGLGAHFWSEGFRNIVRLYVGHVDHLAKPGADVRCTVPHFTTVSRTVQ